MATKKKKKIVTVTGKNGGKIKTTVGSNTYNTLIKNGGSVAGSSSSSSSKPQTREQQIAAIQKQGQTIKSTYDSIKGTITQAERDSLSGSISKASAALTKAGAPSNAAAVKTDVAPYVAPTVTPPTGDIGTPMASIAGRQAYIKKEEARQLKLDADRKAENAKIEKTWLSEMISPSKAREQAQQETGIDVGDYFAKQEKGIKEIESLSNDYNAVVAARDQQIAQSNDKMASMNFINNQTAQIERNAAPKLNEISANVNAKTATLEAQQGNFAQAQTYVNQAVQDATADNKFKFDMYATMYQENKDNFDRIDSIYSTSFKNAMDLAQMEYETQLDEKKTIGEYMLKYPSAGLTMKDTLESASTKLVGFTDAKTGDSVSLTADMKNYEYAVNNGYEGSFADWVGNGSNDVSSNFTSIMQQAIDAGATPEEAAREAALASENLGVPVDQKTLTSWTKYANGLTTTPPPSPYGGQSISNPTGNETSTAPSTGFFGGIWNSLFGN